MKYGMKRTQAQAVVEYAFVIGVVSAALVIMQMYFQRGIQATVRVVADEIGGPDSATQAEDDRLAFIDSQMRQQESSSTSTKISGSGPIKEHRQEIDSEQRTVPLGEGRPSYTAQIIWEDK